MANESKDFKNLKQKLNMYQERFDKIKEASNFKDSVAQVGAKEQYDDLMSDIGAEWKDYNRKANRNFKNLAWSVPLGAVVSIGLPVALFAVLASTTLIAPGPFFVGLIGLGAVSLVSLVITPIILAVSRKKKVKKLKALAEKLAKQNELLQEKTNESNKEDLDTKKMEEERQKLLEEKFKDENQKAISNDKYVFKLTQTVSDAKSKGPQSTKIVDIKAKNVDEFLSEIEKINFDSRKNKTTRYLHSLGANISLKLAVTDVKNPKDIQQMSMNKIKDIESAYNLLNSYKQDTVEECKEVINGNNKTNKEKSQIIEKNNPDENTSEETLIQ